MAFEYDMSRNDPENATYIKRITRYWLDSKGGTLCSVGVFVNGYVKASTGPFIHSSDKDQTTRCLQSDQALFLELKARHLIPEDETTLLQYCVARDIEYSTHTEVVQRMCHL